MVEEKEATDNREYCRECGWCSEEPYSEGCVKYQAEIGQGGASDSFWYRFTQFVRNFVFGKSKDN